MKYLKRLNESKDIDLTESIKDNFIYISDILGQPIIETNNFAKSKRWIIKWKLGINLSVLQNATSVINKLKYIVPELDDVISASERIPNYDFNISLTDFLTIELIPKKRDESFNYKIIRFDNTILYLNEQEVERFFYDKGIRVKIIIQMLNEEEDYIRIKLSDFKPEVVTIFSNLFYNMLEMENDIVWTNNGYYLQNLPQEKEIEIYGSNCDYRMDIE